MYSVIWNQSSTTTNSTDKTDLMLNDTISGSEIHNKNEKANIVNDNELEIN